MLEHQESKNELIQGKHSMQDATIFFILICSHFMLTLLALSHLNEGGLQSAYY